MTFKCPLGRENIQIEICDDCCCFNCRENNKEGFLGDCNPCPECVEKRNK